MKSNVIVRDGRLVPARSCRNCAAVHLGGPNAEYSCGAKERFAEDGSVVRIAECPSNWPLPPR